MLDSRNDFLASNTSGVSKERLETAGLNEGFLWTNPPKRYLIPVIVWLLGATGAIYAMVANDLIALRERTITGAIVEYQAENRHTAIYRFSVDNKVYTGQELGSVHSKIGEQVVIYYDPIDPEKNRLTTFEEEALGLAGPVICMLVLGGAGIFFIFYRRLKFSRLGNLPRNATS